MVLWDCEVVGEVLCVFFFVWFVECVYYVDVLMLDVCVVFVFCVVVLDYWFCVWFLFLYVECVLVYRWFGLFWYF